MTLNQRGFTLFAFAVLCSTSSAEIYRCTSPEGTADFADKPCDADAQVQHVTPPTPSPGPRVPVPTLGVGPSNANHKEAKAAEILALLGPQSSKEPRGAEIQRRIANIAPYFLKQLAPSNSDWTPQNPQWHAMEERIGADIQPDFLVTAKKASGDFMRTIVRDYATHATASDLNQVATFLRSPVGQRYVQFQNQLSLISFDGSRALLQNLPAPSEQPSEAVLKKRIQILQLGIDMMVVQGQFDEVRRQHGDLSRFAGIGILLGDAAQREGATLDALSAQFDKDLLDFGAFNESAPARRLFLALGLSRASTTANLSKTMDDFAKLEQSKFMASWRSTYEATVAAPARAAAAAATARRASAPMPKPGTTFKDCDECPDMVVIPGGTFDMGSPPSDSVKVTSLFPDAESPVHKVTLVSFAIGKFEVTRAQFLAFTRETGYGGANGKWPEPNFNPEDDHPFFHQTDRHPIVMINARDAEAYVRWLARKTGQPYRLPSEAEWEYAARAGTTTKYYWGDSDEAACNYENVQDQTALREVPWLKETTGSAKCSDGYAYTAPVGSFRPNPFGLYDMLGNVSEIVADCVHDRNYNGAPTDGSAWRWAGCGGNMQRGSNWRLNMDYLRPQYRTFAQENSRTFDVGLRVARSLP